MAESPRGRGYWQTCCSSFRCQACNGLRFERACQENCVTRYAQFIAVCSSSILAETPGFVASFSSPWRGKRRVCERHKRLLTDQLQSSTNADTLSARGYGNCDGCVRAILVLTGMLGVRCLPGTHTGFGKGYYKKGGVRSPC